LGRVQFQLTQDNVYRLVEDFVPQVGGLDVWALPSGHWYIDVVGLVATPRRSDPANLEIPMFEPGPSAGTTWLRNMRLPDLELFQFIKTDYRVYNSSPYVYPVAGARFMVFRAPLAGFDFNTGIIGTTPGAPWVEVPTIDLVRMESTSNFSQPVAFYMSPNYVYQLIEYLAPQGFQIPSVQWRIVVDDGVFTTTTIGSSFPAPDFVNIVCTCTETQCIRPVSRLLGNFPEFELPMSGGGGATAFIMTGGSIVLVAAVLMTVIYTQKKKNRTKAGI